MRKNTGLLLLVASVIVYLLGFLALNVDSYSSEVYIDGEVATSPVYGSSFNYLIFGFIIVGCLFFLLLTYNKKIMAELHAHNYGKLFRRAVDKVVYVAGFLGFLATIPQIIKIWYYQDVAGVSVLSWGSYFVLGGVWLAYAKIHHYKPLFVTYLLALISNALIVIGYFVFA